MTFDEKRYKASTAYSKCVEPNEHTLNNNISRLDFISGANWAKQELGWQPISTGPKDSRIILNCKYGTYMCIGKWFKCGGYFRGDDGEACAPTHWMPIPELPEIT